MFKILIAEDDEELRRLFIKVLECHGYETAGAQDGAQALEMLSKDYYDLLVSDIMMPGIDGYSLIRRLREENNNIPVLTVTAKSSFDDMAKGFNTGSDDYMVKPVNINEFVLRVGALIRRTQILNERRLTIGSTVMEIDSLTVTSGKQSEVLPQKEFMLLYKMASNPGKIYTRRQLMDDIWGYDAEDTHTVDVHIGRLRERFKDSADFKIVTIRGLGYKVVKL